MRSFFRELERARKGHCKESSKQFLPKKSYEWMGSYELQ